LHGLQNYLQVPHCVSCCSKGFGCAFVENVLAAYDRFLGPMLLVTLFAPPTELSAAAVLGRLHFRV
jgi:hypothetical protein